MSGDTATGVSGGWPGTDTGSLNNRSIGSKVIGIGYVTVKEEAIKCCKVS